MTMKQQALVLAVAGAMLATPVAAQDGALVAVPMFEEVLAFTLPAGIIAAEETRGDGTLIWEAYPEGQLAAAWTERISILAGSTPEEPSSLASKFSGTYYDACPETFEESAFGSKDVEGARGPMANGWAAAR